MVREGHACVPETTRKSGWLEQQEEGIGGTGLDRQGEKGDGLDYCGGSGDGDRI